jgi:hypothetical protein
MMWIGGLISYYLFHRVTFVYYLGMLTKGSHQRPVASIYGWFRPTIYTLSATLFVVSALFFYLSSPWLLIVPVLLLVASLAMFRVRQGGRTQSILKNATEIQVRMERENRSQSEINKAVYLGATGKLYPLEADFDLKSFLKYCVLNEVIGFDASEDTAMTMDRMGDPNYVSASDKIDGTVDQYYKYWSDHYDNIARVRR